MINSKLLKKGSHVRINEKDYKIYKVISETEFEATLLPGGAPERFLIEELQPIPITEEYLRTYKVEKDNDGKFHSRGNIIQQAKDFKWTVLTQTKTDHFEAHPGLESIHELQFYSRENTGEDLSTFGEF